MGVHSVVVVQCVAASYGDGLSGALAMHWACVHSQTVGHAGAGPVVGGSGSPSVVGGPRVVS